MFARCPAAPSQPAPTASPSILARTNGISDTPIVPELSELTGPLTPIEFNIEGNPIPDFMEIVLKVRPDQCTLVPDDPGQRTSDHGWDLQKEASRLIPIVRDLQQAGVRVSLFMDPVPEQIDVVKSIGAERIELYTEPYARAFGTADEDEVWERFATAASHAENLGLGVNAGHDLNLENLPRFLKIPGILEVSIGHAIIVESFDFGFEGTLVRYLKIVEDA